MNILFISQLYPLEENSNKSTPALHYFVREWAKNNTVKVIRPHYYYEKEIVPADKRSTIDGVEIYSFKPLWLPIIKKSIISKKKILQLIDFTPDIIVCHKNTAYLPFLFLKQHFNVPFVAGIHTTDILFSKKSVFKKRQQKAFKNTDLLVYRSKAIRNLFLKSFPEYESHLSHIANSGVPENIIINKKKYVETNIKKILYVGTLIERKNATKILTALANLPIKFEFSIIGEGENLNKIQKLASELKIQDNITLKGFLPREKVFEQMDNHDFFIMPSINETFGLVYLEAMARGMIVVGMKNTGVDGIIKDGINGFLCEDDSQNNITSKINEVLEQDTNKLQSVINESLQTIKDHTDKKAADSYLQALKNLVNKSSN